MRSVYSLLLFLGLSLHCLPLDYVNHTDPFTQEFYETQLLLCLMRGCGASGASINPTLPPGGGGSAPVTWTSRFLSVGTKGAWFSEDGESWSAGDSLEALRSVAYADGRLVATRYAPSNYVVYSDDGGATWINSEPFATTAMFTKVIHTGRMFVAVGFFMNATAVYSSDGIHWQVGDTSGISTAFDALSYNPVLERIVAGSSEGGPNGIAYISNDQGATWTAASNNPGTPVYNSTFGTTFGGSNYLACGENGYIAFSSDGNDWSGGRIGGTSSSIRGVTISGGTAFAVGSGGFVARTINHSEKDWPDKFVLGADTLYGVAARFDQVVTVGDNGAVFFSEDRGASWTSGSGPSGILLDVIFAEP